MLNGQFRGRRIGSGTDLWLMSEEVRAGRLSKEVFREAESCMNRSAGHCMSMGTASTMASMVEALGVGLPGNAAIPAADARRIQLARMAGRHAVRLVLEQRPLSSFLTLEAFENAIRVNAAIGGSTNAVIHLIAIARRAGVPLALDDWDRMSRDIPCLLNLMPSGEFLMEDFFRAGGLPAVLRELGTAGHLHRDVPTVNGSSIWDNVQQAECHDRSVVREFASPFKPDGGVAVLRGNLCPRGAVIKPSAASPALLRHSGRAVVFESIEDMHRRIDDPLLPVDENSVLVLQHCGPVGYPGMAEVGNLPLPRRLLKQGITDMVRISDARMSGTAFGTVVLRAAPEAALGGPIALVRTGDAITLDVPNRSLVLGVDDVELNDRRAAWRPAARSEGRGYVRLYVDHVNQADEGADLDFLVGSSGNAVRRDNH